MGIRRSVDVIVASVAGLILLPFATAAALVTLPHPTFFLQDRIGLDGKSFKIIKFRTMRDDLSLPPAARITRKGHWWRAYGLDELPQLFSIVKGDMSLIGPRPLSKEEDKIGQAITGDLWKKRSQITPGLIPSSLIEEKLMRLGSKKPRMRLEADLAYIQMRQEGRALKKDVKLIWAAVRVVIARRVDPQSEWVSEDGYPFSPISLQSPTVGS